MPQAAHLGGKSWEGMEQYSGIKRNVALMRVDEPGKRAEWKKPDTKGFIVHNPMYTKCPEQVNP